MALRLRFRDRHHLWSALIYQRPDRIFVHASEQPTLGAQVSVEVATEDARPLSVTLTGVVVGFRPRSERFGAGAFVRFGEDEVDRVRRALGLTQQFERDEHGRRHRRVPCSLRVVFTQPPIPEHYTVKNLSTTGVLVACPRGMYLGQMVEMRITLDDGSDDLARAEVLRDMADDHLAGLQLVDLDDETTERIARAVERLSDQRHRGEQMAIAVLADDDPITLGVLSDAVAHAGYEVHTANRGDEALTLIRTLKPRLVMLDVLMPGMDGADICRLIRGDVDLAHTWLVLISSLEGEKLHEVANDCGASDYLTKPIASAALKAFLAEHRAR